MNSFSRLFFLVFSLYFTSAYALKLQSYNTGIAHSFVAHATKRLPFIPENIIKSEADVVCLQEVWNEDDQDYILDQLDQVYPYHFRTDIKQTRTRSPSCWTRNLFGEGKFVTCMNEQCSGYEGDDHTTCIISQCRESLELLKKENRSCATALMAQVGSSAVSALLKVINPFWGAGIFSFGGGNGLMILSKIPLEETDVLDFSDISTLNRRAALSVKVKTTSGEEMKVMCTHLTANLDLSAPYTGKFKNWEEEQAAQIDRIIKDTKTHLGPIAIMGDFNCSVEDLDNDIEGDYSSNCKKFDSYFVDPIAVDSPECTYCKRNSLVSENEKSMLLDHIFVRDINYLNPTVNMKNFVEIIIDDMLVETNVSDHYGLSLEVLD